MPSRNSLSTVLVAVLALAVGIFVGYADSHSDDVPLTLVLLFGFSFLVGFLKPRRVWRRALLVGIWVPVLDALLPPIGLAPQEPASTSGLLSTLAVLGLVMAACFAGAFAGALAGKAARGSLQSRTLSH
jgi:hypothetical protein